MFTHFDPLELLMFSTFVLGFFIGTVEQLFFPAKFKARELRLFRNHRTAGWYDRSMLLLAIISAGALLFHLAFESFKIYQLFTYVMIIVYAFLLAFFFSSREFSSYLYEHAAKKPLRSYVMSGYARLIFLVFIVMSPYLGMMTMQGI